MQPTGIITLTTDFGLADSYVGVMKGVILGIAPTTRIVDITHTIQPQDVHQAAYIVQTFAHYFPAGTVHLVVVDPGVGSARRAIAFETPEATFIGPDNGVLTAAWRDAKARWRPDLIEAVELADSRFWLPEVSRTFHGRDIFAPVAAHIVRGTPLSALGPRLPALYEAPLSMPKTVDGVISGRVVHIDHFGNCITNIPAEQLAALGPEDALVVVMGGTRIYGLHHTFVDVEIGALAAYIGSSNFLEVAIRNGHAARTFGLTTGDPVRVSRKTP